MTTVSTGATQPSAIGSNDQDLQAGFEVGEYRIERVLGKGGFGTVYGAVQPVIGKQVAIKVLARKYSADPDVVSRFVAEARAVNQIRHRNIIDIFSFGQLPDGRHYYVMEHLEGEPLDAYLRTHGPLGLDEAIPILRSIARALDAAHAKGIAHRDLKPENIFLARDADGSVFPKLLDFGIAKLLVPDDDIRHKTNTGVPLGTPYYMSPEQCRGRDVDHRTDIYSFGIVAYRVLTGAYPLDGDDYMELLYKQVNEEPLPATSRNPELPASVDEAIAWMMRKDRTQRPPRVIEAVNALDPAQAVTPSVSSLPRAARATLSPRVADALAATYTPEFVRPEPPAKEPPVVERRRSPLWIGGVVIVALAGAVAALLISRSHETPRPPVAPVVVPAVAPAATPAAPPSPVVVPAAPVPSPTPATDGSAAAVKVQPAAADVTAQKRKQPKTGPAAPAATGSGSAAAPTTTTPDDPNRPRPGDLPSLGSDAFK